MDESIETTENSAENPQPEPSKLTVVVLDGTVVFDTDTGDYSLQIQLGPNEMRCTASVKPFLQEENLLTPPTLLKYLDEAGICEGLNLDAVNEFCQRASRGEELKDILLAETSPPKSGDDGWLEFLVKLSGSHLGQFNEDDKGRIDLYTLNLFTCVEPGQEIALVHPPTEGLSSVTVTGKLLLPEPGKDADFSMGSGLHLEGGEMFVSDIAGRVEFNDGILAVSEDYVVHGDVDLEIGNIKFPGNVQIRGDVLDEFDIYSLKEITVVGTVGACHLTAKGDVTLGSMAGKQDGRIICGGTLKANYLNGVYVECMGDVIIGNEIRNCVIKSAGRILIPNGQISGGECIALKGIEAKVVGATAGVLTKLTSGVYFPETDRLQFLKNQQKSIELQKKLIHHCMGPLKKLLEKKQMVGHQKRLEILQERLTVLETTEKEVTRELKQFTFGEHEGNAKINIQRLIKEKVVISLDTVTEEVRFEHYGPLSIIAHRRDSRLSFNEYSELTVNADDMEPVDEPDTKQAVQAEEKKQLHS
ncbi:MAG: DUF342 domain-containing protein [Desulfuromonadaceae bacterium]|nr:DUF342 domain-containing protein [Desulfuromonadaceae bacterium]